jgi:transcriptional regulator with XRE-family HTH domain/quercetin dioxygenase-like cupin family protein
VSERPYPPIGQRIREERLRRGFNLRSLARSVNVSASHISQIETGKCRPSVSTLYDITSVLGVSIDDLFAAPAGGAVGDDSVAVDSLAVESVADGWVSENKAAPGPVRTGAAAALVALAVEHGRRVGPIVSPDEREVLELDSGVTWERLGHVPGLHVDFLLITYAPGGNSSSTDQLMRHPGTEYGYLISGELVVTIGFEQHTLVAGDAISFPSSTPHRYRNLGREQAVGVWFVASPDSS